MFTTQSGTHTINQSREVPSWLKGPLQQATAGAQNYYTNFQPNANTMAGIQGLAGLGSNPNQYGYGNTLQNFNDLMSGQYLYGGEGFNAALDAAQAQIQPRVQSAFNANGRLNSGLAKTSMAEQLGHQFANLYNDERNRQMTGLSLAPQMADFAASPFQTLYGAGQLADNETETNLNDYISRLQGIGDVAGYSQSESSPLYENPLADALGLGLTGLGLYNGLTGGDGLGSIGEALGLNSGSDSGVPGLPPGSGTALDQATGGNFFDFLGGGGGFADFAGAGLGATLPSAGAVGGLGLGATGIGSTAGLAGGSFSNFAPGIGSALESGFGGTVGAAAGSEAGLGGLLSGAGGLTAGLLGGVAAPFIAKALFGSDNPMFTNAKHDLQKAALDGTPIKIGGKEYIPDTVQPIQGGGFYVKGNRGLVINPQTDGTYKLSKAVNPSDITLISGGAKRPHDYRAQADAFLRQQREDQFGD